jgi:hypothetical protein
VPYIGVTAAAHDFGLDNMRQASLAISHAQLPGRCNEVPSKDMGGRAKPGHDTEQRRQLKTRDAQSRSQDTGSMPLLQRHPFNVIHSMPPLNATCSMSPVQCHLFNAPAKYHPFNVTRSMSPVQCHPFNVTRSMAFVQWHSFNAPRSCYLSSAAWRMLPT